MKIDLATFAASYHRAGICVLPAIREEKRPALDGWKRYQSQHPTDDEINKWFVNGHHDALCLLCGKISGNLEVIDFDQKGRAFEAWKQAVESELPGLLDRLVIEQSPSGGFHVFYRCEAAVGKNENLARTESKAVLIETRAEGGLILCAPTPGYKLLHGQLHDIPVITEDECETLLVCARILNERPPEIIDGQQPLNDAAPAGGLRPGDEFNLRGDIRPQLREHGWRPFTTRGKNEHWTRPGKERGTSATFNGTHFYVFSSNADPFDAGRAYTKFAVRAYLEHARDFSAAARELRREGFGSVLEIEYSDIASGSELQDIREVLGTRHSSTGRLILQAGQTVPSAEAFLHEHFDNQERFTLVHWNDEFFVWERNRFIPTPEARLHAMMLPWLDQALMPAKRSKSGARTFVRFKANPRAASEIVQSVASLVHIADSRCPCWLSAVTDRPDPSELLVCPSGSLHLPTGEWIEPTPNLFTTTGLDFNFTPRAPSPSRWLSFLDELFGDDRDAINLLQQWFGYCLTPNISLQKMLLIVGPPRSGKGTIARVLQALVGAGNCVGPTVGGLTGPFGMQPLLGKSLATVSDARFTGHAMSTLVERLLCISGEDVITVDRKHRPPLTVRLPTRVMFLTNEIPEIADSSGALASRFEVLRLRRSFLGEEDIQLASQLLEELPGILNWAVEGWHQLRSNGRLTSPESSAETKTGLAEAGSPVLAFINEQCDIGIGRRVAVDDLFQAWRSWCEANGATPGSKQMFGRQIGAVGRIERRRGTNESFYEGIAMKDSDV